MIGTKIYKDNLDNYTEVAKWCNANNAMIVEREGYYEVVSTEPHVPTKDELKSKLKEELETIKSAYIGASLMENNKDELVKLYKEKVDELKLLEQEREV
ncbi:hypothetical protein [uncultured Veillonella sp.]|uniref:hypothetical protein n=1 Tax=uncultured Veillonella sp. TaxID=159268 RepID=UPI0025DC5546|nr:hypothetical protein [uncultured Veillonella sp.]